MSTPEQHWDVFISAKNTDYPQARQLHDFLLSWGIKSFFSPAVLPTMGRTDYRREIDRALDSATNMIVVSGSVENINSRWVEAEWGGFINELRSGRKSGNLLTVIVGNMKVGDLPFALRQYEVMSFDPSLFETILPYISSSGSLAAQIQIANENENPISIKKAVQWGLEAALGLSEMHKHDLVHCDLKPSSILLDGEGHARVGGQRLAQTLESLQQDSAGASNLGTREYMPPEQLLPNADLLRASVDVYALGSVLFELLTGQVYFYHEGKRPSGLRADVPLWLDDLVICMLNQEPKKRPKDGGEAAELLRQGLKGEQAQQAEGQRVVEEEARQKRETAEREQEQRQKKEVAWREQQERQAMDQRRAEAEARRVEAEEEARKRARVREEAVKKGKEWLKQWWLRILALAAVLGGLVWASLLPGRPFTPAFTSSMAVTSTAAVTSTTTTISTATATSVASATSTPNILLFVDNPKVISIRNVNRLIERTIPISAKSSITAISPDGKRLAIVGGEGIDFFESPFWQWSRAIAVDTEVTNLVFSPDGTWLIGSFANQDIKFWHISDGVSEYTGTRHEAKISSIGISSDGAFLASLDVSGNLFIWDINRKAVLKEINNSDRIVTAVWSPVVSSLLVLGTKSGQIVSQRYPDDKSLPPQYINNPGFPIAGFAFSLDGSTLASFSEVGPIKLWKVADGSPMQTVNCPSGRMSDLVFSRDGSLLIASTSSVLSLIDLFDIQNGKFLQTLKKENGKISNLFLFPDGMLLGYITNDSNLHIWSIE